MILKNTYLKEHKVKRIKLIYEHSNVYEIFKQNAIINLTCAREKKELMSNVHTKDKSHNQSDTFVARLM